MSSQAASSSCDYATSKTHTMIRFLNKVKFVSCVLAMSKIKLNNISKNFAHAAILLIDTETDMDDDSRGSGLVVEYGDYNPTMSKEETEAFENGEVVYRYSYKGGLRYYAIDYSQYIKIFGDVCYVSMDIEPEKRMTINEFIDKIAPKSENYWIQEKYKVNYLSEIFPDPESNFNCQTFAYQALDFLKPTFDPEKIVVTDELRKNEIKNKIEIFPTYMEEALNKLKKINKIKL
jgi:hypothetical protein